LLHFPHPAASSQPPPLPPLPRPASSSLEPPCAFDPLVSCALSAPLLSTHVRRLCTAGEIFRKFGCCTSPVTSAEIFRKVGCCASQVTIGEKL
jgi:hypothetical protein